MSSSKGIKPAQLTIIVILGFAIPILVCILAARFSIFALDDHMMDDPEVISETVQRISPIGSVKLADSSSSVAGK
ncbi:MULTISPECIES: hypothetical protein [Candidatus Ichthyocystis]|uniref:hypothetical protein n=1 Tax=Candidatus Ichthyocystis TaxID=2929841 RepID=UPI000B8633CA|nr:MULTISPECIES: hypothetical protein [Ichthyocystis]